MGYVKEVVKMRRHTGLAAALSTQHSHQHERLGRSLDRCLGEDAVGADEFQRLDLDGFGRLVEVLCEDHVCDLGLQGSSCCWGCGRQGGHLVMVVMMMGR